MEYRLELEKAKWKDNMPLQVATHCAPVLAGIKPSNSITLNSADTMKLIDALKDTGVQCRIIHQEKDRCLWLLYRKEELEQYLLSREHQGFLKECGYDSLNLLQVFANLCKRYEAYKFHGAEFPHELGLILGYPLCDVKGFMEHQGRNFLYSGYWKIYGNVEHTKKMFQAYDLVRYQMIRQVEYGRTLRQIVYAYRNYQVPKIA
jgi:hypothetical protein